MGLSTSTSGQLLYVHQVDATIDLYEAATDTCELFNSPVT